MKKLLTLIFAAALLGSCVGEPVEMHMPDEISDGNAELILRLNTPGGFRGTTRALSVDDENTIDDIYVLTFDDTGNLTAIVEGSNVKSEAVLPVETGVSGEGTFTVTLPQTEAGKTIKLVVLANAGRIVRKTIGFDVDDIAGKGYDAVIAAVIDNITGAMYTAPDNRIPMWGELDNIEIKPGFNRQTLEMVRCVARVDVGVGAVQLDPATGTWSWNGKDADGDAIPFELTEAYIISPNKHYAVVPAAANRDPKLPTVPATTKFTVAESEAAFAFVANGSSGTQRAIYLPESDVIMGGKAGDTNHEQRMALVVGGSFDGGTTSYYRLDFAKDGDLMNVLRNHLYQFNISSVMARGYDTVEDAYKSMAVNMAVEVRDWDNADISNIYIDGPLFFGIDELEVIFMPFGGQRKELTISSNIPDLTFTMDDVELKVGSPHTSANYIYTLTSKGTDTYELVIECPGHNVSKTERTKLEQWSVMVGSRKVPMTVSQQWTSRYISVLNGQSSRLFPEGGTLPIEIISPEPVTVSLSEAWLSGEQNAVVADADGLYSAKMELVVPVFEYDTDGMKDRTAVVTITPQGHYPVIYSILQEVPYLHVDTPVYALARPAEPCIEAVPFDVITNIQATDLTLSGGTEFIKSTDAGLYNADTFNPRHLRLDTETDFNKTLPEVTIEGVFTIAADPKYGLSNATATVSVTGTTFGLKLSSSPIVGGTVTADKASPVVAGEQVTLTATPAAGYGFASWTVNSGGVTLANTDVVTFTMPDTAVDITAHFTIVDSRPYILYWDSASGTIQASSWKSVGGGPVTQDNILYFKFGSVVGFTNHDHDDNEDSEIDDALWLQSHIVFEPSATKSTTWDNIPKWGDSAADTSLDDGHISSPDYHTLANVQSGRGDPCKLIGLSVGDIAGGTFNNDMYRLPTDAENNTDYGFGTQFIGTQGTSGRGLQKTGNTATFLPAAGYRSISGATTDVYSYGRYWSSRPHSDTYGYSLIFGTSVGPSSSSDARNGDAVRCILMEQYAVTPAPSMAGGNIAIPATRLGTFHEGMVVEVTATPDPNHRLVSWTSTSNKITFADENAATTKMTVNADGEVGAVFEEIEPVLSSPQSPYLLYWDGERMQLGAWGTVTQSNMLFFQFGSVVGLSMTSNADLWTGMDDVKFNPPGTEYDATIEGYENIPNWNGASTANGYISSPSYHNEANTKAGRGDPCMLAGLTVEDINAGVFDNGLFRLPTDAENMAYASATFVGTQGEQDYGIRIGSDDATFLPAAGYRNTSGATSFVYNSGCYWSSRPYSAANGYDLGFDTSVNPSYSDDARLGFAVRCVPQESYSVSVREESDGTVTPSGSGTYHKGMVVPITATPIAGYKFVRWTSNSGNVIVTDVNAASTTMKVNGAGIVIASFEKIELSLANPTAPYLLYWDGERMQVGAWGTVTQSNVLFFKFGSVVGFTNNNDAWTKDKVVFNLPAGDYTTYGNIPSWNETSTADGYISSATYHTLDNVKDGRGDPCKLAGLTVNDIKAGVFDNEKFRLPTDAENQLQYSSPIEILGTEGSSDYSFRVGTYTTTTLPATGYRDGTGVAKLLHSAGFFWSSKPNSGAAGHSLGLSATVNPSNIYPIDGGFAVRCVPQKSHSVIVQAGPGGGTVTPSGTRSYHDGMVVPITATPSPGSKFANWTSTSDNVAINNTDSTVTMMVVKGTSTVTANFVPIEIRNSQSPYLLYWDSFTSAMQLGAWGVVTPGNMLFFQFGSVIGTTLTGPGDSWGTDDIKFNPTNISAASEWAAFADVPNYSNYTGDKALVSSISGGAYHTASNVRSGFGDPCKLVGLTLDDILRGNFDNGMYRLPTDAENAASYGSGTRFVGTRGESDYGLRIGEDNATFLPAAGGRSTSGSPYYAYDLGRYWSSRTYDDASGYILTFNTSVYPSDYSNASNSYAVRCVSSRSHVVESPPSFGGSVSLPGSGTYSHGMVVEIKATPVAGYKFVKWVSTSSDVAIANDRLATTTMTVKGAGTVTAEFAAIVFDNAQPPYLLYWNSASGTIQLGAWATVTSGGKATQSNLLFFQFGSVVGLNMTKSTGLWSGMSDVVFNPPGTNYAANQDGYRTIPGWDGVGTMENITGNYISSTSYHTLANVLLGRGDPCMLAGLTIDDINAGNYDNGKYRLPTNGADYSSGDPIVGTSGQSGRGLRIGVDNATFLPAAGYYNSYGGVTSVNVDGIYQTSTPDSPTRGCNLYFTGLVYPTNSSDARGGAAVRCVPR